VGSKAKEEFKKATEAVKDKVKSDDK